MNDRDGTDDDSGGVDDSGGTDIAGPGNPFAGASLGLDLEVVFLTVPLADAIVLQGLYP